MCMLAVLTVCLTSVMSACGMGKRSSNSYDTPRATIHSAFKYDKDFKFAKRTCLKRGPKTGKCYTWSEPIVLDLKIPEDEIKIRETMILVGEADL
jgi:hypothetical protein